MEDMKGFGALLPAEPSDQLAAWVEDHCNDDLGGNMLLFNRESMEIETEQLEQTMTAEEMNAYYDGIKRVWGARCTCTACGEEFEAGYFKNNYSCKENVAGIFLARGEDETFYPGYVAFDSPDMTVQIAETDHIDCPYCGADVQLVRRSDLRNGRTYQVCVQSVENIGDYTAIITWLARREFRGDWLSAETSVRPRDALVIDRDGKLHRYSHTYKGQYAESDLERWESVKTVRDGCQLRYYNWDAANHRQVGGRVYPKVPELAGKTGEKAGIEDYIKCGGEWPAVYLQTWARRRNIENLVRCEWARVVVTGIESEVDQAFNSGYGGCSCDVAQMTYIDWAEVKPHRMMHMDKVSMRRIRAAKSVWTWQEAKLWDEYRLFEDDPAEAFDALRRMLGTDHLADILEMDKAGWNEFEPRKVARYLEKQKKNVGLSQAVRYLIDYRKMLRDAHQPETEATLWPRDLMAAHERAIEWRKAAASNKYAEEFKAAYEEYKALEWTDGDLCIRLPRCNADLEREGDVLRHCVGGYGQSHVTGYPIFFVRHYRRPERSYYTLNIDMRGALPREIQLHGYGNEHHGSHKEHYHTIPQKVRDFCDRWEREVLTPWFAQRRTAQKKQNRKKKEKTA